MKSVVQNKSFTRIHYSVSRKPWLLPASIWLLLPLVFLDLQCYHNSASIASWVLTFPWYCPGHRNFLLCWWRCWLFFPIATPCVKPSRVLCRVWFFKSYLCFHCCGKILWPKATWIEKGLFHLRKIRATTQAGQEHDGKNWMRSHGGMLTGFLPMVFLSCYLMNSRTSTGIPISITN